MTETRPTLHAALQAERLRLHRSVLGSSVAASAIFGVVLATQTWTAGDATWHWLWLLCLASALAARLLVAAAHGRASPSADGDAAWLRRYRLCFAAHGLVWALAPLMPAAVSGPDELDLLTVGLVGIAAGSLIATAFDLAAALLFAAPALTALVAHLLITGHRVTFGGVLILSMFLVVTVLSAVRMQRLLRQTVKLGLAEAERAAESRRNAERADRALHELADKHRQLDTLLQTTPQGFWFIDAQGVTSDINPAMCTLLGRPREAIVGRPAVEFFAGDDLRTLQRELRARQQGQPGSYEIGITRADGSRRHCFVSATPLFDAARGALGAVAAWTDISALRQATMALRTYELAVNSIADMVSVIGEDHVYRMVNDEWCRRTGLTRAEVIGRPSFEVLPWAITEERRRALAECIEQRQPRSVRAIQDLPDRPEGRIETSYYPYADDDTGVRCVVVVSRDVTTEERAMQLMRDSAAEQRALLDAFPGYIARLDADLVYTYVNERVAARLGTTPQQMVGRSVREVSGPQHEAWLREQAGRVLAGETVTVERHHDSGPMHGETDQITLAAGVDARTGGTAIYAFGIDITERKRAEQALRDSEAELRAVLAAFPGYIVSIDQHYIYTYCNGRMAEMMGRSVTDIIGRHVRDVLGEERYLENKRNRDAAPGQTRTIERVYRRAVDQQVIAVEVTYVSGSQRPGGAQMSYAFGVDITARKHAELALVAARDEADRANRAKSEFLSRMSHELRTPLNAILGFGQLLEGDAQLPAAPRSWAGEIVSGGHHLLELINEVLDLARVESGKFTVSVEPVALPALLEECLTLVRPQARSRDVRLPPALYGCDVQVMADRTRLKQALLNVLSNAVKYNRAAGTVSLGCTIEPHGHGRAVRISIGDNGAGLTREQQQRLFVPFERLDADHAQIEGTGIGLALSKRLVELMHGSIGVDSTPGVGSTFWIRLPLAEHLSDEAAATVTAAAALDGPHGLHPVDVLCIEDNPTNLHLIESMLAKRPHVRLLSAMAPGLGLELARTHRPALILLDINLPDMDGYAVLQCLHQHEATRHIPVLAISANAMPKDVERGRAAGFTDYLTKPIHVAQFLAAIDRLLDGTA